MGGGATSQRGAAWAPLFLMLAGLSYVAMGALVRYIAESERLHPFQIAFLPQREGAPADAVPLAAARHLAATVAP